MATDKQILVHDENYRKGSSSEKCGLCRYISDHSMCNLYPSAKVSPSKVCNSFEIKLVENDDDKN